MNTAKIRQRRRTAKEHGPDPIDVHVGRQLRQARELLGMTQVEVGRALSMSFQVVQKYEQGDIRVSASRLFQLSQLLAKPVAYFFDGVEGAAPPPGAGGDFGRREIELVRAFRQIASEEVQQRLLQLVRGMAEDVSEGGPKA